MEFYGGFRYLKDNVHSRFPSSLAINGSVEWSTLQTENLINHKWCETSLVFSFPNVDWANLQKVYGWAALQYQGWARGSLMIHHESTQTVILYTDGLLEFWIDDKPHFGGDFYAYRRAPLVLRLDPGLHRLDLRFVREVRTMGGVGIPTMQIRLKATISGGGLSVMADGFLAPDIIDHVLVGRLASIPVRNDGVKRIEIVSVDSVDVSGPTICELAFS